MLVFTLLVISCAVFQTRAAPTKEVSNEDIRDAILTLIRRERQIEEKLNRHEFREKDLGEYIKKMLVTLDKRTKLLDFTKAAMIKFEERLTNIETILSSNTVKSEDQAQKTREMETSIKDISSTMVKMKGEIIQEIKNNKIEIPKQTSSCKDDVNSTQTILTNKVDNMSSSIQKIGKDLLALKDLHQAALKLNKNTSENFDKITLRLSKNEEILQECQTKLEMYSDCSKIMSKNIDQVLEKQKNDTEKVLAEIKTVSGKMKLLPEIHDLQTSFNSTVNSLESLKTTINANNANSNKLLDTKSKAIMDGINKIPKPTVSRELLIGIQTTVSNKMNAISSSIQNIHKEISKLKGEHVSAQQLNKQTSEQAEQTKTHLNNVEDILVKYENKLAKYNNSIEVLPENIKQVLDKKCDVNKILTGLEAKFNDLPLKNDLNILQNSTLRSIEYLEAKINEDINNAKKLIEDKNKYILAKINTIEIPTLTISKEDIETFSNKIDPLEGLINDVQKGLSTLKLENECSRNVSTQANEHMENVKLRLNNNEKLLEKYEDKLATYNDNIAILQQNDKAENGWHDNIIKVLEKQRIDTEELLNQVRSVSEKMKKIPEKDDLNISKEETLKSLDSLKRNTNKYFNDTKLILEEKVKNILNETTQIQESLSHPDVSKADLKEFQNILSKEVNTVNESVEKVHGEILKLENQHDNSQKLTDLAKENMELTRVDLDKYQNLLDKYNVSLTEYDNKIKDLILHNDAVTSCCTNITQALEEQTSNIEQAINGIGNISNRMEALPVKSNLETAQNQTLKMIKNLHENIREHFQDSEKIREEKVEKILQTIKNLQENNTQSSQKISDQLDILVLNLATSHQALIDEITSLGKLEQVVLQAADGTMDIKRRVEYGIERILLETGDMVKRQSKNINSTITERFDMFEDSLLGDMENIFKNLTLKLGDDIDQVWRQIGMMHQQMRKNTDTLDKLQNETDTYVNGSLNAMDSLKNKFGKVSDTTSEIDKSVNYLMGKLLLVSKEFNEIKTALGDALDEIKQSFGEVKDKIKTNANTMPDLLTEVTGGDY